MEKVSWDDAQEFIKKLNEREQRQGLDVPLADRGGMGICLSGRGHF